MKILHYRSKVLILVCLLLFDGLFSVVLVTTVIDPPVSSTNLTGTFRSLTLFPSPLLFGNQLTAVLVNHSVFDYGTWFNTSNLERTLVRFDFNADFTNVTHIKSYNITFPPEVNFLNDSQYGLLYMSTTDGQQFYFLGVNVNQGTFKVFVVNLTTLTVTKTFSGDCMVGNIAPTFFNFCDIGGMAL